MLATLLREDFMRYLKSLLLLTAVVVLIALPASAADNGFYIGGSVGQTELDTGDLAGITVDDNATGFKAFAGVRMLTFLAVEGSYIDFGTAKVGSASAGTEAEAEATGYQVQAMGMLPLGIADIFVKAGMMTWDANLESAVESHAADGTDPVYGAGAQFRIQSFAIRGEVEYFDLEDTNGFYMYSAGVSITF